jgi:hypothetical protein
MNEEFVNPIDVRKTAQNPGLLPYAHTVGAAIIKPLDQGRTKGLAMQAMVEQSGMQLHQIKTQIELLMAQAQAIHDRMNISETIYKADCRFKPLIGHIYHLYHSSDTKSMLSMIGPLEWGRKGCPHEFKASVKLLADHTWQILTTSS